MIYTKESQLLRSDCDIIINLTDSMCEMKESLSKSLLRVYPRLNSVWGREMERTAVRFMGNFEIVNSNDGGDGKTIANLLSYDGIDKNIEQSLDMFTRSLTNFLIYLNKNNCPRNLKIGLPYNYPLNCGVTYYKIISDLFEKYNRDVYLYKK